MCNKVLQPLIVVALLIVLVSFSATGLPSEVQAASPIAISEQVQVSSAVFAQQSCKTVEHSAWGPLASWRYSLRVYWCYDGKKITMASWTRGYTIINPFWEFVRHEKLRVEWGQDRSTYYVWTKGHFQYYCGVPLRVCLHKYPWVAIWVNAKGQFWKDANGG